MDSGHFGKSRQNSLKRTHKQTLKKLEDNIRRLSSDVGKLYNDVSSFSIPCSESKPSRRKLFESVAAMTHHIGNLSTNEYYLNKNVRDLARNVCVEQKMVSFQTALDRKDDDGECKKFPKAFTNPHSKERQKFLSKVDKFSKHYSKSPKLDSFLPGHVKTNRKSMNFFLNDTVGRNPMIMKPSRSLHCRTTKREFDKHKLRKEFDCESVDGSVFRSISVCSATADNIGPPFIRYNQFTADKVDQFTPKRVAPFTDRRHLSFNKFNQLTADKLDYDRCSLQWEESSSNKRPSSFRDFVHKSAVLDKCGNVVSESSCGSGVAKRRLKQRGEVGTSSCHPVSPTLFVKQQCSSSTEMINRHINSLNNKTVLMPLQKLEISHGRDVKLNNPLGNSLVTEIMTAGSCHSLTKTTKFKLEVKPSKSKECIPAVWPLECPKAVPTERFTTRLPERFTTSRLECHTASPPELFAASRLECHTASRPERFTSSPPERFIASPSERFAASPSERFAASPSERFAASPSERFTASPSERFAASPSERFASSRLERFAASSSERLAASPPKRFAASPSERFASSRLERFAASSSERLAASLLERLTVSRLDFQTTSSPEHLTDSILERLTASPLESLTADSPQKSLVNLTLLPNRQGLSNSSSENDEWTPPGQTMLSVSKGSLNVNRVSLDLNEQSSVDFRSPLDEKVCKCGQGKNCSCVDSRFQHILTSAELANPERTESKWLPKYPSPKQFFMVGSILLVSRVIFHVLYERK